MDKEIIKAMATKFSEIFAIIMLKKNRKFCRRGLTHFNATPIHIGHPVGMQWLWSMYVVCYKWP